MDYTDLIPSLALFTLVAVLLVAVIGFLLFKRKAANRHPMEKAGDEAIVEHPVGSTQKSSQPVLSTDELQAREERAPTTGGFNRPL